MSTHATRDTRRKRDAVVRACVRAGVRGGVRELEIERESVCVCADTEIAIVRNWAKHVLDNHRLTTQFYV